MLLIVINYAKCAEEATINFEQGGFYLLFTVLVTIF